MLRFFHRRVKIWIMMRDYLRFELQPMPKGFCTEVSLLFQISKISSTNPTVTCPSLKIPKIWQYTRCRALNYLRRYPHSPWWLCLQISCFLSFRSNLRGYHRQYQPVSWCNKRVHSPLYSKPGLCRQQECLRMISRKRSQD